MGWKYIISFEEEDGNRMDNCPYNRSSTLQDKTFYNMFVSVVCNKILSIENPPLLESTHTTVCKLLDRSWIAGRIASGSLSPGEAGKGNSSSSTDFKFLTSVRLRL